MRILTTYFGHESNMTIYENGKVSNIELDKISSQKWIMAEDTPYAELGEILEEIFSYYGGNKFDVWVNGSLDNNDYNGHVWEMRFKRIIKAKRVVQGPGHHFLHTYCAFYQSPFEKALTISCDGGGNDGSFNIYRCDKNGEIALFDAIPRFDFGTVYGLLGSISPEIKEDQHFLNIAGKAMGLAPFYTPPDPITPLDKKLKRSCGDSYSDGRLKWVADMFPDLPKNWHNLNVGLSKHGNHVTISNELEARRVLYWNQYTLNNKMKLIINDRMYELFSRFDGNLVLTGGVAMNVTLNEFIKNMGIDTFVPCNPSDRGLSLGMMYWYLHLTGMKIPEGSQHLNGMPLIKDTDNTGKKATIPSIVKLLKDGAIIGVAEGDSEVGQRALGRRSIICDPSYPDIKDKINTQVKFREKYRPFAPMVLEEHLDYFKTPNTDNLEWMSYAVKTTEEFQEKFPAVCHIDGTARVQLCTDTDSSVYKIMKKLGTPLLNTSFNIQGQPIIARESEAFVMLEQGGLDAILLNGVLYKKPKI